MGKGKLNIIAKDFTHNWSILKNINVNLMSLSMDSDNNHIMNPEKEGLSAMNEAISNIEGITTSMDDIENLKNEINNKNKIQNNISYNFNYFRNLIIVVDLTERMNINDYKPTRHKYLFKKLENFITNFFKYNLLSTITIIKLKDYTASIGCTYSSDPVIIIQSLKKQEEPQGFPSIYNALSVNKF